MLFVSMEASDVAVVGITGTKSVNAPAFRAVEVVATASVESVLWCR